MNKVPQFVFAIAIAAALLAPGLAYAQRPSRFGKGGRSGAPTQSFGDDKQQQGNQKSGSQGKSGQQQNHPHIGKWLQEHRNLPPQQQEKDLEKDPEYRNLNPEGQQRLKERLRRFNALPPEQQQRTIQHMQAIEQLPPEKRAQFQNSISQFRDLPPDRRQAVRQAFRSLRDMPPDERERTMNSDQFRNSLNDNERSIVDGLLQSGVESQPHPRR